MAKMKSVLVEKYPSVEVREREYKPGCFTIGGNGLDLDEDQAWSIVRAYRHLVGLVNSGDTEAEKILDGE